MEYMFQRYSPGLKQQPDNGKKCPLRTVAPDRDDYDKNALCAEMFQAKRFVELNKSTGWLVVLSSKKDVGGGWFAWFKWLNVVWWHT